MAQGRAVTSAQTERLLEGLRFGMTRRAAAAYAGMSKTHLYLVLERDKAGTLRTAIENAEGEAEAVFSRLVAEAAAVPRNWTAAAWWLERRHPDNFGRKDRVEIKVDLRTIAERVAPGLDVDAVLAEAERIMSEK